MMKKIKRMFSRKFIDWKEYQGKIEFIEEFNFQQFSRKQSINNMPEAGR